MDPISLTPPPAAVPEAPSDPKPKSTEEAARQFEALLISQMLRTARESAGAGLGSEEDGGNEAGTMMDLAEQQFAKLMAQNGGLGLTRLMMQGLETPKLPPPEPRPGH
jgi:Rod binding domain-containing protein